MADNYHPPNIFPNSSSYSQTIRGVTQVDTYLPIVNEATHASTSGVRYEDSDDDDCEDMYVDAVSSSSSAASNATIVPTQGLFHDNHHRKNLQDPAVPGLSFTSKPDFDLLQAIKGMYRILDLISEQGSGGLVDKVIIDQASLRDLINTLSPGAYVSLTKVNFKVLDELTVKPIGVYGSKDTIVSLLSYLGAVESSTAHALLSAKDGSSCPHLRTGLYLLRSLNESATTEQLFAIYWPEDTTWNDNAVSSVRRNRVTFMRYLTKIADQVVSLINQNHADSMVWSNECQDFSMDIEDDQTDRLFTFEVAKTNEQEEGVTVRPGFTMTSHNISNNTPPAGCIVDSTRFIPLLLAGETAQAFTRATYIPSKTVNRPQQKSINSVQLQSLINDNINLKLTEYLDEDAINVLLVNGLEIKFPKSCSDWKRRQTDLIKKLKDLKERDNEKMKEEEKSFLEQLLRRAIIKEVKQTFPALSTEKLDSTLTLDGEQDSEHLQRLLSLFPDFQGDLDKVAQRIQTIDSKNFKTCKERMITARIFLTEYKGLTGAEREELANLILKDGNLRNVGSHLEHRGSTITFFGMMKNWFSTSTKRSKFEPSIMAEATSAVSHTSDAQFITSLQSGLTEDFLCPTAVKNANELACLHFESFVRENLDILVKRVEMYRQKHQKTLIKENISRIGSNSRKESLLLLIQDMEKEESMDPSRRTVTLQTLCVEKKGTHYSTGPTSAHASDFKVSYEENIFNDPVLEYRIHMLDLTTDDRQSLQLDPTFIPSPHVHQHIFHSFQLPVEHRILHGQLLENDRLLLIIDDHRGTLSIYLERLSDIANAVARQHIKKKLHREKIGTDCLIAFDERKRMLSVCASAKLQLHIFVFDESFMLQTWGSALDLVQYYTEGTVILLSCFVCGNEEVLLIDNSGQARIFSMVTQQFRPATLHLDRIPTRAHSSPDGACLILSFISELETSLRAYHWSTFGSTPGIPLDCPGLPFDNLLLTSVVNRTSIHFISLDIDDHTCKSLALNVTQKTTEFMFKEKGTKSSQVDLNVTVHNSLIDCHEDVWTRFPVVPAISRRTSMTYAGRHPKKLVFVTDRYHDKFCPRFFELLRSFEYKTRKPIGDELKNTIVVALSFQEFVTNLQVEYDMNISRFNLGEWIVDILCLIPIQIAVARENRFIPLKDGVTSTELEQSLLGAEVGRIVDNLSLGWYESIFQSYMVSKPVKVVSSLGEQSVGKSFALNHLVDTSFAGSAMRTTEGVWMAVTPTQESLIVALDFEGVHSIERSAQEDTLLVLFNAAISNLVLFRNNFALSRDIAGLFQSFQSSSTVLDPAANPSLFQSRLVIIIKDVVDSDKAEIVREFSLKFQRLVQEEQSANFISKLHAGQLDIIPWPVIESKQFYALFPTLKKRLDQQPITHATAGEFLFTLKTLMAKLKANDWGALSQTLAAHRAQYLLNMLHQALILGANDADEPLKNIDSDTPIDVPDSGLEFYLSKSGILQAEEREQRLAVLRLSWHEYDLRSGMPDHEWIAGLSAYLDELADMRIHHVGEWMTSNLSRFKTKHANIEILRRAFEDAIVDLKANVQLCKMECVSCRLSCVRFRGHEAEEPHDCQTDHRCTHICDFSNEHPEEEKGCGYPAGHFGIHLCAVDIHLCGEPCVLKDKNGCSGECTKVIGHTDEEHMCSARVHACSKPCMLVNVRISANKVVSCPGTCAVPSGVDHQQHICSNRMCPLPCQLCKRLCDNTDHLHGLEDGAEHLCGQGHSCSALCGAKGICEIDTAPQSIEATFTGRHETFQYTKYSQVAKRLPCIIVIPPGQTEHTGPHSHSTDRAPFHFCETRCDNCGYFCTLPRGHTQQEHETRHGSMSKTRWAMDGPDGTVMELNGRKFGADDDGAPMMCSLYCSEMGRHVHLDYCRADSGAKCQDAELQHITTRLEPHPGRPKDWVSHRLYWRRTGFKDPYSREDQANFAKCDSMCGGPEHAATATTPARPSYCTLPIFHPPQISSQNIGLGYLSHDGHVFSCKNPAVMQQAFHVIFVIDRSGSMFSGDRCPLPGTTSFQIIARYNNNRLGAVYSALHSFWISREAALNAGGRRTTVGRRDAYSVLLFDDQVETSISNDLRSSPDQLLNAVIQARARGGTNYDLALRSTQGLIENHWSNERTPVVIFLSDGECSVADETVQTLCRSAVARGKPLSFQAVAFGPRNATLRRMAQIALEIQNTASRDQLVPETARVDSSCWEALDSVRLAETFLGLAESLKKPRGALMH